MVYLVPTPIGNLQDITYRAVNILKKSNYILTEDSRNTRKLLDLLDIGFSGNFVDLNRNQAFNEARVRKVLELSKQDPNVLVSVVTDAGTPGLSDPGREVVELCIEYTLKYSVLPGANSLSPVIGASPFIYKEFLFLGFLPIKKGRQKVWKEHIITSKRPVIVLESVHRLKKFLAEAVEYLHPEQRILIYKDISKMYEKVFLLKISELNQFEIPVKGEYVIAIEPV